MKVGLVTGVKNENATLREWVEHYYSLGFYRIFIWDNNDVEDPMDVLQGYEDFVKILDHRNANKDQLVAYNTVLKMDTGCDWLAFFDADEYLVLKEDATISDYLSRFPDADCIHINWKLYGDNGHLHPVPGMHTFDQFPKPCPRDVRVQYNWAENEHIKTIVRTGLWSVKFNNPHYCLCPKGIKVVNNRGLRVSNTYRAPIDYTLAELRHYQMRSTEEFCMKRLSRVGKQWDASVYGRDQQIRRYFAQCERTPEKEELIKNFINGNWK